MRAEKKLSCYTVCQIVAGRLKPGSTITGHAFVAKVQKFYRREGLNPPESWTIMRTRRMVKSLTALGMKHPKNPRGQKSLYLVNPNYEETA